MADFGSREQQLPIYELGGYCENRFDGDGVYCFSSDDVHYSEQQQMFLCRGCSRRDVVKWNTFAANA